MSKELPPCDPKVFTDGGIVTIVAATDMESGKKKEIEDWVISLREKTGDPNIDWHYAGGRGVIKALRPKAFNEAITVIGLPKGHRAL